MKSYMKKHPVLRPLKGWAFCVECWCSNGKEYAKILKQATAFPKRESCKINVCAEVV
jgi:hypothetical protein